LDVAKIVFSDNTPNPHYEQGGGLFNAAKYDAILAVSGGSVIM
jgi:alcohol dehydrogenase YqhD (iron-dependent ADH family)